MGTGAIGGAAPSRQLVQPLAQPSHLPAEKAVPLEKCSANSTSRHLHDWQGSLAKAARHPEGEPGGSLRPAGQTCTIIGTLLDSDGDSPGAQAQEPWEEHHF